MGDRDVRIDISVTGDAAVKVTRVNEALGGTERRAHRASSAMRMFKGALGAMGLTVGAKTAVDLTKALMDQGKAWQNAEGTVIAYTGSTSAATRAIEDAQAATHGLVSKTDAAIAVNTFFRNGLADTGAEAGKLAQTGQILSGAYEAQGATFEKYIRFLSTGNIALADNFNLTQAMIDERADLIQTTREMSDTEAEAAARMELLNEAAEGILETMPDVTREAQEFDAAVSDLSSSIGVELNTAIVGTKGPMAEFLTALNEHEAGAFGAAGAIAALTGDYSRLLELFQGVVTAERDAYNASYDLHEQKKKLGITVTEVTVELTKEEQALADLNERFAEGKMDVAQYRNELAKLTGYYSTSISMVQDNIQFQDKLDLSRLRSIRRANEAAERALAQRQGNYARHQSSMAAIDRRAESAAISHANTVANLRQQIERAANAGIAAARRRLSRALEDMADRHADKIESLRDRMADLESDYRDKSTDDEEEYQDDITDMTEDHESRRADLVAQLYRARTLEEKHALEERIREEDAEFAKQMARKERDHDQAVARAKREHEQAVQEAKDRITEEDAEYREQRERAKRRAEEDMAALKAQNAQRVADLQARLAMEEASFARMQAELERQREEERASIAETLASVTHFAGTAVHMLDNVTSAWRRQTEAIRAARDASYSYQSPYNIPGYQAGTSYVRQTGPAILHRGEAVIPAAQNRGGGGGGGFTFVYSPGISLGDKYEAEKVIAPLVREAVRRYRG
jgi:hypothetical protein